MPCTCNAICDADCAVNRLCSGYEPACGANSWPFTSISPGDIIRSAHLLELEAAINQERTNPFRRYNSVDPSPLACNTHTPGDVACTNNAFATWGFTGDRGVGDKILAAHWENAKDANNEMPNNSGYGGTSITNFVGDILASHVQELQTKINQSRTACICDSHCNCDPSDCGCNNADCGGDEYYYLPNPGCYGDAYYYYCGVN